MPSRRRPPPAAASTAAESRLPAHSAAGFALLAVAIAVAAVSQSLSGDPAQSDQVDGECTIERVDAATLTDATFSARYFRRKPVLLTNLPPQAEALTEALHVDALRESQLEVPAHSLRFMRSPH